MKRILLILMLICYLAVGCVHKAPSTMKVETYTTKEKQADGTEILLYWYIMFYNNQYYYVSSPTPISDYSTINWNESPSSPIDVTTAESLGSTDINTSDLSADTQGSIDAAADSGTDASADSGTDASSDSGSDNGGDSGSSDAGSSDAGGGDSGGGDGGSGGE